MIPIASITCTETWVPTPCGALYVKQWTAQAQSGKAPLVLMHDSLGSVALWRDLPEHLTAATGRDVIAYDRLGFGQSDAHPHVPEADFVEAEVAAGFTPVYQALGLQDFVLLGHSVGGGMACMIAAAYPSQCKALITESAQSFAEERTLQGIREARDQFAQPGQLERLARHHGDKAAWVLSAWVDVWLSEGFAHYSLQKALSQVHCPVLAMHGERDEYGSLAHPENIGNWTQGSVETEIFADAGHVLHREQPERFIASVAQFLSKIA